MWWSCTRMAGQLSCALCWKPYSASLASAWQSPASSHSAPFKSALLPLLPHHHAASTVCQSFCLGCTWSLHACCAQHCPELHSATAGIQYHEYKKVLFSCHGSLLQNLELLALSCRTGAGDRASAAPLQAHMLLLHSIDLVV